MPLHVPPSKAQRMRDEFARVSEWMQSHGAHVLVDNLAPGATPREFDNFEQQYHLSYPDALRALWSLHAGQRRAENGYFSERDFLGPAASHAAQQVLVEAQGSMRPHTAWTAESGLTLEDAQSDAWFVVAARGDNNLVVLSGLSGRVYARGKDPSTFRLTADSLLSWLEHYAYGVQRGEYQVTAGLGDAYLEYTFKGDTKEERYFLEQISSVVPDLRDVIGTAKFPLPIDGFYMKTPDKQTFWRHRPYARNSVFSPYNYCFSALTACSIIFLAERRYPRLLSWLDHAMFKVIPLSSIESLDMVSGRLIIECREQRAVVVLLDLGSREYSRRDRLVDGLLRRFKPIVTLPALRAEFEREGKRLRRNNIVLFVAVGLYLGFLACCRRY